MRENFSKRYNRSFKDIDLHRLLNIIEVYSDLDPNAKFVIKRHRKFYSADLWRERCGEGGKPV